VDEKKITEIRKKVEALAKEIPEKDARIKELETAVANTTKANEELKSTQEKAVNDAKAETAKHLTEAVVKQLDEIIVPAHVEKQFKQVSARLLNTDVRRLKRRLKDGTLAKS